MLSTISKHSEKNNGISMKGYIVYISLRWDVFAQKLGIKQPTDGEIEASDAHGFDPANSLTRHSYFSISRLIASLTIFTSACNMIGGLG
jgi:hypothetical protein